MVRDVFGRDGVDAVFAVMSTVHELFWHVEPERVTGRVVVFKRAILAPSTSQVSTETPVDLAGLANSVIDNISLEVGPDGRAYRRELGSVSLNDLAQTAVVYVYAPYEELVFAGSKSKKVIRLDTAARSQFAVPSLTSLRAALAQYASECVRESTCYLLQQVWFEPKRLFFRAKPEAGMRRSLTQFLRNRLGAEFDVAPEQNVDESHPVDIRVRPRLANNRLMLVEIKWLGASVEASGAITVRYRQARARQGADQLAAYLDSQRQFAPNNVVHGYLVIVDGRRRRLTAGSTSVSPADGLHYETSDISFQPKHHSVRNDFDPPYRMFARPVLDND